MVDEIEMIASYRARIIKPISAENPVGELLIDDIDVDFIESEMMKIGSLSHATVQWERAENTAILLLETRTKDLKVLTHLLLCLQHFVTAERLTLSLFLMADFISLYWKSAYPILGTNGQSRRLKFFSQILNRTHKMLARLNVEVVSGREKEKLMEALSALESSVEMQSLPIEEVHKLQLAWQRKVRALTEDAPKSCKIEKVKDDLSSRAEKTSNFRFDVDISSEISTRKFLLNISNFLIDIKGVSALVIRLRRFAIWHDITAAPGVYQNGETSMREFCPDTLADYTEKLNMEVDLSLWEAIEESLSLEPFWIDGHFLSYQVAMRLGEEESAKAIVDEARCFLERVPAIQTCLFKGGAAFISEKTRQWLNENSQTVKKNVLLESWDSKRKMIFDLAKRDGLPSALNMINEELQGLNEPREQFYWRLLSAEIIDYHNLSAISTQYYRTFLAEAENTILIDWEPSLIQRLKYLVDAD